MSDLFGNHIVGYPTRQLITCQLTVVVIFSTDSFAGVACEKNAAQKKFYILFAFEYFSGIGINCLFDLAVNFSSFQCVVYQSFLSLSLKFKNLRMFAANI